MGSTFEGAFGVGLSARFVVGVRGGELTDAVWPVVDGRVVCLDVSENGTVSGGPASPEVVAEAWLSDDCAQRIVDVGLGGSCPPESCQMACAWMGCFSGSSPAVLILGALALRLRRRR